MFFECRWRKCLLVFDVYNFLLTSGSFAFGGETLFFHIEYPEKLSYTYEIHSSDAIGVPFPSSPLKSLQLKYSIPITACEPIQPIMNGAVLIERGGCSFVTKAINADKAGAQIALITDSASESERWIEMISDGTKKKSNIPVAFLPGVSGKRIRSYLMHGEGDVRITIPLNISTFDAKILQTKPPWELW
uniref:PA domain-containing protein n=1 Tax=Syphacia muris TaxID=451379 RepID=A0A0N5AYY3_9BILA